ncbi:MAG: site-specific integrase [Armatimonadetes bacterium]|nr:site-specific integrase [Armatimonadota bacterium]
MSDTSNGRQRRRRDAGEGSIFYLGSKERWVAEINLPDGKTKRHMAHAKGKGAAGKREVQEWLREAVRAAQDGTLVTGPQQTLASYLQHWLTHVCEPSVKYKTFITYRYLLNVHVFPELGNVRLDRITPQHVQALKAKMLKETKPAKPRDAKQPVPAPTAPGETPTTEQPAEELRLSPRTVLHTLRVLHRALREAVRQGLLARNPCDLVTMPRASKPQVPTLDEEQVVRFLRAVRQDPLEALYVLAVTTGLREGELLALRWQDIDMAGRALQVRRTVWYCKEKGFVYTEPKSASSRRRVELTDIAKAALERHRERQAAQRHLVGEVWEENDLVICNAIGGPLKVDDFYRSSYKKLLAANMLPDITFHALRHTVATQLLIQGEHPRIVQEMLGHSTIAITMDTYSHVAPTLQQQAVDRLNRRFAMVDSLTVGTLDTDLETDLAPRN